MDRYYKFSTYLKDRFGCRVQKISVDAGFSCPNRDGTLSTEGCIYCENKGFSVNTRGAPQPLAVQIEQGIKSTARQKRGEKFMVYFQAYTNTYAPVATLRKRYGIIHKFDDVVALAIGTRPDCVDEAILEYINTYTKNYEVWLEYGLQSMHDATLQKINRGHSFADFLKAIDATRVFPNIKICVHVIIGLPDETEEDMIKTATVLGELKVEGVKIHPLHVIRGTKLEELYRDGLYTPLPLDKYIKLAATFLAYLPPTTVIQRISADCPPELLVAPAWLHEKASILSKIDTFLAQNNSCQGHYFTSTHP